MGLHLRKNSAELTTEDCRHFVDDLAVRHWVKYALPRVRLLVPTKTDRCLILSVSQRLKEGRTLQASFEYTADGRWRQIALEAHAFADDRQAEAGVIPGHHNQRF